MYFSQFGEVVSPMATEIGKDLLVRAHAQESADDFDSQDLTIGQGRLRATLAQAQLLSYEPIVSVSKHGNNECANIHLGDLPYTLVVDLFQAYEGLHFISSS